MHLAVMIHYSSGKRFVVKHAATCRGHDLRASDFQVLIVINESLTTSQLCLCYSSQPRMGRCFNISPIGCAEEHAESKPQCA